MEHETTKHRYIHPYDLEDIEIDEYNDRQNNAVWFPIESEDIDGIKRYVKKYKNISILFFDYLVFRIYEL